METPQTKSYGRHFHGQLMSWKTTTAVLLLALGIVVKTTSGSVHPLPSVRVVGGENAKPGSCPWQVALLYNFNAVCGGALIFPSWVLTAAHCMKNRNYSNFHVLLGVLNLTGETPTRQVIEVVSIRVHEMYNGDGTSGDMALIKLKTPATITENVRTIELPPQNQEHAEGTLYWLSGWGNIGENVKLSPPHTLQRVQIPLISNSECSKMLQSSIINPVFVQDDMICAGKEEGGIDGCHGDSGGPLVFQSTNGTSWLIGLVSWGYGCAQPNRPGVYTRVSSFLNWVQNIVDEPTVGKQTIEKNTVNVSMLTTQMPNLTSQVFTSMKETDQGTSSAGSRLQIPLSLTVMVMALLNILVFSFLTIVVVS